MPSALIAEFRAQLAAIHAANAGDPRGELDALWLVGLEREAIVTVAYRRDVILQRLAKEPLSDEVRDIIGRAIRWAWRDEEAHSLWVRGALLRRADRITRVQALAAQVEGWVGGWVSSRQHHLRWSEAPFRKLVAEIAEVAAGGHIPPAARESLHWSTFAEACRFNAAAETTAGMGWRRMSVLALDPASGADPEEAVVLARMADDEDRHARIFGILAESLAADGHLVGTADDLRARLASVGQRFVAVPASGAPAWGNPLGKGGVVAVREGEDLDRTVADALIAAGIPALLAQRPRPVRVAVKTTFMLVTRRSEPSPGVSPRVLASIRRWFADQGAEVVVIDAPNIYDRFHAGRSVGEVSDWLGVGPVVDAIADAAAHGFDRGIGSAAISATWRDADVRILLGKLRGHPTATAFLTLEAAEGLAGRHDEHLFVERQSERETAVLMALDAFPPHAAVLDAWEHVPDGLLGVFGSDRPLQPRRIYASTDAVALDAVVLGDIGVDPASDGLLCRAAFDWFGDPRPKVRRDGTAGPIAGYRTPSHSARSALLAAVAWPVFTHASARGALFLPEFDPEFPPLEPPGRALRAARAAVWRIVRDPASPDHTSALPTAWLAVRGGRVRIARLGSGPPVVLLHGYPDDLQIFARLADKLAHSREVLAFDWPGMGFSPGVAGPLSPEARAAQLADVLDAAGIDRCDLVAMDMGAHPALVFAAKHPERVGTLTVMNALLFGDDETSLEISVMRRAGLARAAFRLAPNVVLARCKATFLPPDDALDPAVEADIDAAFLQPSVREALIRLCADTERALPHLPDVYWQIRRPVRLLWAEHDGHFPPHQAERLCALLPEATAEVLPGAKHWMCWSRADEVAKRILAWTS